MVPLIFQNRKDPKTVPTFYCRILSIFVHHISTSNHLPAPGMAPKAPAPAPLRWGMVRGAASAACSAGWPGQVVDRWYHGDHGVDESLFGCLMMFVLVV